jgi:hypothetical protein
MCVCSQVHVPQVARLSEADVGVMRRRREADALSSGDDGGVSGCEKRFDLEGERSGVGGLGGAAAAAASATAAAASSCSAACRRCTLSARSLSFCAPVASCI